MDDKIIHFLEKLDTKLDKQDSRLDSIDRTQAVQTKQLKEHIRRTEILETQMVPIKRHVDTINLMAKILVGVMGIATALMGLVKYIIG